VDNFVEKWPSRPPEGPVERYSIGEQAPYIYKKRNKINLIVKFCCICGALSPVLKSDAYGVETL